MAPVDRSDARLDRRLRTAAAVPTRLRSRHRPKQPARSGVPTFPKQWAPSPGPRSPRRRRSAARLLRPDRRNDGSRGPARSGRHGTDGRSSDHAPAHGSGSRPRHPPGDVPPDRGRPRTAPGHRSSEAVAAPPDPGTPRRATPRVAPDRATRSGPTRRSTRTPSAERAPPGTAACLLLSWCRTASRIDVAGRSAVARRRPSGVSPRVDSPRDPRPAQRPSPPAAPRCGRDRPAPPLPVPAPHLRPCSNRKQTARPG